MYEAHRDHYREPCPPHHLRPLAWLLATIFTNEGGVARRFTRGVEVGMVGINVPILVPMAFYSFCGWKASEQGRPGLADREDR